MRNYKKYSSDEFEPFSKVFNVQSSGNFEDFFGENVNKNILHLSKVIPELADELSISPKDLENKIDFWRKVIFDYREKREKPFKDKKIMTDWNGLMVAGLSVLLLGNQTKRYFRNTCKLFEFL